MKIDYRLYLVTEETVPVEELLPIVEEAIQGGVTIVQLREKYSSSRNFYEKAIRLKELTETYQVPLIINDRVDIALAAGADGIHIGQDDLPVVEVKKLIPPSMIVGVSCHSVEEALKAESEGADYIGIGAIFPTKSKNNAKILAEGVLKEILNAVSIPVVAIGGINSENVVSITDIAISGVAVVSEIINANSPFEASSNLRQLLGR